MIHKTADVDPSATIGEGTKVWNNAQVREGAKIGKDCIVGTGAYIGVDVIVGDRCKIENYACLFRGVKAGNEVFIGPHVCFTNDRKPRADGAEWDISVTLVEDGASIGANATILPGCHIGMNAMVGAGAVVTRDVSADSTVVGNPAREK